MHRVRAVRDSGAEHVPRRDAFRTRARRGPVGGRRGRRRRRRRDVPGAVHSLRGPRFGFAHPRARHGAAVEGARRLAGRHLREAHRRRRVPVRGGQRAA